MKISKENIEIILFDYAEGNLSNQERKEVEAFLEKNPQYKQMLSSYQECEKLSKPLNIVFEDKDELFALATGKKARKIVFAPRYVKWACGIAAVLLLFFAIKPLLKKEVVIEGKTPVLITQNKTKKKENNSKKYFSKTKKNFYFSIEDENDTIIHQFAFIETELATPKIESETKFIKQTYRSDREIIIEETPKFIIKAKEIINFAKELGEEKLIVVEKEFKVKTSKNV